MSLPAAGESDDSPAEETQESQDPAVFFHSLMNKSKQRVKARREQNRLEYVDTLRKIEEDATKYFGEVVMRRSEAQKARINQLSTLLQKRFEIEEKMIKYGEEIERTHEAARREVQVALKGRVSALEEYSSKSSENSARG